METVNLSEEEYLRMLSDHAFIWGSGASARSLLDDFRYGPDWTACASRMGMLYADLSRLIGSHIGWGHSIHLSS